MLVTIDHDRSASASYLVTLVHETGLDLEYDGEEILSVELWPGDRREAIAGLTAAWETAPDRVTVTVPQAVTEDLEPGVYQCRVFIGPEAARVWAAEFRINLLDGPGSDSAPLTYGTYDDLLRVAPWVTQLAEPDIQAGFAEQRREAREWLDAIVRAKYQARRCFGTAAVGWVEVGDDADVWLQARLDDDALDFGGPDGARLKDAVSHYAASRVAARQLLAGAGEDLYHGRMAYHLQAASALVQSCVARLDTNDDGTVDLRLPLVAHRVG